VNILSWTHSSGDRSVGIVSAPLLAALAGLGLGLSLIVAIGAQNAFVLRQGLRREHVLPIVLICALSDAVLIAVGVGGGGALFTAVPWLVDVIRWVGAAFLIGYGILAARRALRRPKPDAGLHAEDAASRTAGSLAAAVATALALTWLNPHVYLDTVLLLGSVASTHDEQRWWFAGGAVVGSILWFTSLGFGARLLAPLFAKPVAWRILDGIIAVVMFAIAASLLLMT
jgi:L-lysine exporter family protein LysE/ArgO